MSDSQRILPPAIRRARAAQLAKLEGKAPPTPSLPHSQRPQHHEPLPALPQALKQGDDPVKAFLAGQLSERTRKAYRTDLQFFLIWLDRPEAFKSSEGMIRALLTMDRSLAGIYRDHLLEAGLAPATVARKMCTLNGIYKALKADNLVAKNPFEWVKRPRVSPDGKTPAFTKEQAEKLLSIPNIRTRMGMRDRILLFLLFYCGLRRSEVVKVKLADFYQDRGYIVLKIHGKGVSAKIQRAKVPQMVWNAIAEYAKKYDLAEAEYLFSGLSLNSRYNKSYRPISAIRVYLMIKSYCERAGLDPQAFSTHSTRATAINLALDGGASIRQVQAFARHSDPKTTMRYDRHRNDLDDNAVDHIHLRVDTSRPKRAS